MYNTFGYSVIFVVTLSALPFNSIWAQTQVGNDIDGEATLDASGTLGSIALSSNGNRIAIGAPGNDGNGTDSGHVRIFEWSGESWTQLGINIEGEAPGDRSGSAVSLSLDGNRVAIGAFLNAGNGFASGHVRIYEWNGGNWTQLGDDIDGKIALDAFGIAVSLSSDGSRIAVGGTENVNVVNSDPGHVRVYEWNGGNWIQLGEDLSGDAPNDYFGNTVSLSPDGNRVAIGANGNDGNGSGAGHVRIFEWNGESWVQLGSDIDGEASHDAFGFSVSLSSDGNRVAIGAIGNDNNGTDAGHARIFEWNNGSWMQLGDDIRGEASDDNFGMAVSLSSDGNRIAAGASGNDGNGTDAGHVRIFEWSNGSWIQLGNNIDGEMSGDRFGLSVSLSADGTQVASGTWRNDGNGTDAGHVRIFDLSQIVNVISIKENEFDIYPNPTTGKLEILGSKFDYLRILDAFGNKITEKSFSASSIDISELPGGVYFIQIKLDEHLVTKRIIKL